MRHPAAILPVVAALAALLLAGCGDRPTAAPAEDEPVADAQALEPAVMYTPPPPPQTIGGIALIGIDFGTATTREGRVIEPKTSFGENDRIHATLTLSSDEAFTGTLSARMVHPGGRVFATDEQQFTISGPGIATLSLASDGPWAVGTYKLEIRLDGAPFTTAEVRIAR